ncbi:MAG: hypothetical protein COA43_12715 [Robiginitomaculum sp.]|nr:MAG: hypothetical protein COA43_12715 [Robiginitomaculum sp.]
MSILSSKPSWQKVEHLLNQVLDLPEEQREEKLREFDKTVPKYAKPVRHALIAATQMTVFDIGVGGFAKDLLQKMVSSEAEQAIGSVLSVYRLDKVLGQGGMGVVYLGTRNDGQFEQQVAIKKLPLGISSPEGIKRFEEERAILATVRHPYIASILDGGIDAAGLPFVVLELIDDGERLDHFVTKNEYTERQILNLFCKICKAVMYLHQNLIVHGDLKPSNILIRPDGYPKIIDFGIANLLTSHDTFRSPRLLAATPGFSAPEQSSGGVITTRADIFVLGCSLEAILPPQKANSELFAIIKKCKQENVDDRYTSVEKMFDDITAVLNHAPVSVLAANKIYKVKKYCRRNWLFLTAGTTIIASLTIGLGSTYRMLKRTQASEKIAQAAKLDKEYEARVADGYRIGLQTLYGEDKAPEEKIDPKLIDKSILNVGLKAKEDFDITNLDDAFLLFSLGKLFKFREDFENAVTLLSPLEAVPMTTPIMAYLSIESRSELARSLIQVNEKERAEKIARQLLIDREKHNLSYTQTHIQDAQSLAKVTGKAEDEDYIVTLVRKSIEMELQKETPSDSNLEFFYNQLAYCLYRSGKIMESLGAFEKSFEMQRKQGIRFLDDAAAPTNLAQFQIYLAQDGVKPEEYLPDYLSIASGEQGSPTLYALIQGLRGEAALLTKRWDLAEQTTRLALEKIKEERRFRAGWYYDVVAVRVQSLTRLGRYDEARELFQTSLAALGNEKINARWEFKECKLYLAEAYLAAFENSKEKAAPMFDAAEAMCKAAAPRLWSKETITQNLISRMRKEALQDKR